MSYPTIDSLTTLANVKLVLGIATDDTTQDNLLNYYITGASSVITQFCNRPFFLSSNAANPISEYYSGNSTQWLTLRLWPIQSVASIYLCDNAYWGQVSGSFGSTTLLVQGQDYAIKYDDFNTGESYSAQILRINDIWDSQWTRESDMLTSQLVSGRGNIYITYTYGFQSLPSDLTWAATALTIRMLNEGTFGRAINSESYQEYNYNLAPDANDKLGILGGDISTTIAKYRIIPFGIYL